MRTLDSRAMQPSPEHPDSDDSLTHVEAASSQQAEQCDAHLPLAHSPSHTHDTARGSVHQLLALAFVHALFPHLCRPPNCEHCGGRPCSCGKVQFPRCRRIWILSRCYQALRDAQRGCTFRWHMWPPPHCPYCGGLKGYHKLWCVTNKYSLLIRCWEVWHSTTRGVRPGGPDISQAEIDRIRSLPVPHTPAETYLKLTLHGTNSPQVPVPGQTLPQIDG